MTLAYEVMRRYALSSSSPWLAAFLGVHDASPKTKREIQVAKLPEVDVTALVSKLSSEKQMKFTPNLIPLVAVIAKCRANKFVELAECRFTGAEYSCTQSEMVTSVAGAPVEVLKRTATSKAFLQAGEITACLIRLMMAYWLAAPVSGNFLVLFNNVLRVTEMGNHSWGKALRLDHRHRENIITKMAADGTLTIYDMFEDDMVTASFSKAILERDAGDGKDRRRDNPGKGSRSRKRNKSDWSADKPHSQGRKDEKSRKFDSGEKKN
ncbi:hypothetical protein FOZ60_010056 [Perkinsus olseni]|uniref:Uncharacterized protein n=1 Tax=Perkinsus olseni TaxID=32597 RepID=A0A7J6Q4Y8_PEROL|nr:hypothetical protein FOZ60_010056 [Perkinsus olseni]KAF4703565.1 hypothetical protein FOZ62_023333 [Perkinsus olseni]